MTDSVSLITAQVAFLDSKLVLVHIPLELYTFFLQPILQLLFGEDHDEDAASIPWVNRHEFLNFSITPLGCSIVCSKRLAHKYIEPVQQTLNTLFKFRDATQEAAEVYPEIYTVIQVDGQGLDAGQRVIELTGPLAMADIPIFFITTYFCDYILVPYRARQTVTSALEQRGFVFSQEDDAFVSQLSPSLHHSHFRNEISSSCSSESLSSSPTEYRPSQSAPSTPPIRDIDELQARTFEKLKKSNVRPLSDETLRLVNCAGSRDSDAKQDARLKNDLLQVLLTTPRGVRSRSSVETDFAGSQSDELDFSASFLSLTITASEPISILLEERLLPRLGQWLYGAKTTDDVMAPITFDLSDLAIKTTGIVGGVAGRLCHGQGRRSSFMHEEDMYSAEREAEHEARTTDISFLSTARAGTVIVRVSQLERAMNTLRLALEEVSED